MLKLLWKVKWLRKFLRGSKKCRSLVEASGLRCDDFVVRGTPYCFIHQGKFPWFISTLPVLLSALLVGFLIPRVKSKWFPTESERTLRQLAHQKVPKLQFFVSDDASGKSPGTLMRVGAVIVPIDTKPKRLLFSLQNVGDAPLQEMQTVVRFDRRLSFTSELKRAEHIRMTTVGSSEKEGQFGWFMDQTIHSPDFAVLPLTFQPTNPKETPMNLNFHVKAKDIEPFEALLTLYFTPGTGSVTAFTIPGLVPTNGPFIFAVAMPAAVPTSTNLSLK